MGLPNKGSKYYIMVNEDEYATEKWERFIQRDTNGYPVYPVGDLLGGVSPPPDAVHYKDFISVDYTDGDFGDKSNAEPYTDGNVRRSVPQETVLYQEPNPTIELGFRDLLFIFNTFCKKVPIQVQQGAPQLTDDNIMMYESGERTLGSVTHYVGKYDDEEYRVRGAQLDEFELDFSEDGIITASTKWISSKDKLGPLKEQSKFETLIQDPIQGWNLNSVWLKNFDPLSEHIDNKYFQIDRVGDNDYMSQVGCSLSSVKLNVKFNLDTDQGRSFCQQWGKTGLSGNMNQYLGELFKNNVEITLEVENNQTTSNWLQRYYGGGGSVEYMKTYRTRVALFLKNTAGEEIKLLLPNCTIAPNTPSLTADGPTESITFNVNTGSAIKYDVLDNYDMADNGVGFTTCGIRFKKTMFTSADSFTITGTIPSRTGGAARSTSFVLNGSTGVKTFDGKTLNQDLSTNDWEWDDDDHILTMAMDSGFTITAITPTAGLPRGVADMYPNTYKEVSSQMILVYTNEAIVAGIGEAGFYVTTEQDYNDYFANSTCVIIHEGTKEINFLYEFGKWGNLPITPIGRQKKVFLWSGTYSMYKFKDTNGDGVDEKIFCGSFVMDPNIYHTDHHMDLTNCYKTNTSRGDGTKCVIPPVTRNGEIVEVPEYDLTNIPGVEQGVRAIKAPKILMPGVDRPFLEGEQDLMDAALNDDSEDDNDYENIPNINDDKDLPDIEDE